MSSNAPKRVGSLWGIPYDWRKPTAERFKSRLWNPNEPRLLTPRAYGWGYELNWYWLFHSSRKRR